MRWLPAAIAGFAEGAGFQGEALEIAIAIAIAGSGGDDGYHWCSLTPGGTDMRGLWQIDVSKYPRLNGYRLFNPEANAKAAYELWREHKRTFAWSQVYVAGTWVQYLEIAKAATSPIRKRQTGEVFPRIMSMLAGKSQGETDLQEIAGFMDGLKRAIRGLLNRKG